jgi:YegS/Rv2252/BmrU family lipid kinase
VELTETDDILVFANPIAGRGRGRATMRRVEAALRREGWRPILLTQRPDTISDEQLKAPARAAVAIGGDGTLRAVADRLLAVGTPPPLLVVPLGTANLMAQHLGLRWNVRRTPEQLARSIRRGQLQHVDAARANGALFLLMAGVGFDAHIVHELQRIRTGPITYASYLMPAVSALAGYRYRPLRVTLDGEEIFAEGPAVAFVGNVREYGVGFPMLPRARSDDRLLDVCVMPCRNPVDVARLFALAAIGRHPDAAGVVYRKGTRVTIESPEAVPVQLDGDPGGFTPIEIDLLPTPLPFIVP